MKDEKKTHPAASELELGTKDQPCGLLHPTSVAVKENSHLWSPVLGALTLLQLNSHNPGDTVGFPGGSDGKESVCNMRDAGLILESGRSPGEGNGYPLQYSSLENPMDRGAWQATVYEVAKSQTRLSK